MLRPLKSKQLIPEVSKDLNVPEGLVSDLVSFYWKEVRASMSSLAHTKINIINLGSFNIKRKLLRDKISNLEKGLTTYDSKVSNWPGKYHYKIHLENLLTDYKRIQYELDLEDQRKEFIYDYKKGN